MYNIIYTEEIIAVEDWENGGRLLLKYNVCASGPIGVALNIPTKIL